MQAVFLEEHFGGRKRKGRDLISRCSKWYLEAEKQIKHVLI